MHTTIPCQMSVLVSQVKAIWYMDQLSYCRYPFILSYLIFYKIFKYIKFCLFATIAVDQILTHWFATMLLALRYAFRQARDCVVFGKYYIHHYS